MGLALGICFLTISHPIYSKNNDHKIIIRLDTLKDIKESREITQIMPDPFSIWANKTDSSRIDSVCYVWEPQPEYKASVETRKGNLKASDYLKRLGENPHYFQCEGLPYGIYFMVKKNGNNLSICLNKQQNPFLDKDIVQSYLTDSLKRWNRRIHPEGAFPVIHIKYPFCVGNEIKRLRIEFVSLPLIGEGWTLYDKRMDEVPLTLFINKQRLGHFSENEIFVSKNVDGNFPYEKSIYINIVSPKNNRHRDLFMNGVRYKDEYRFGDTVYLDKKFYRFDSTDASWTKLYLTALSQKTSPTEYLPASVKERVKPFFTESHKLLVMDFWGTWCAPCVEELLDLKDLYEKVKVKYNFVSICFDKGANYKKAEELFRKNGIPWGQIFDPQENYKESLTVEKLRITTFPSFIVVDRSGEIIFKGSYRKSLEKVLLK